MVFLRYLLLPGVFGFVCHFCCNGCGFGGASYEGEVFWVHPEIFVKKAGVMVESWRKFFGLQDFPALGRRGRCVSLVYSVYYSPFDLGICHLKKSPKNQRPNKALYFPKGNQIVKMHYYDYLGL